MFNRHQIWANLVNIVHIPKLRGALITVFVCSSLCAPLLTFSPVLVKDGFHGNAAQFSIAVSAFGVGGLLGAVGLLFVESSVDRRLLCSWSAGIFGMVLILTAINPWFWGLALLLVMGGIATSITNISTNTLIQASSPAELRGQAVSLFMLALRGGLSVGSLVTGISISFVGVNHAFMLNGAIALILQVLIGKAWLRYSN